MKKIAPSILSADFTKLGKEIQAVEKAGADYIHIDVMDGHFVPNITVGPILVKAARKVTKLPLDVHLMIENPDKYIDTFREAGSDIITVHIEVCNHLNRTISYIKETGAKAGVSINPSTPLSALDHIISDIDLILVMTVNPGFGGQGFIDGMLSKIRKVRKLLGDNELNTEFEVDGGIKVNNIGEISKAGADVFVSGSGIFGTENYKKTIAEMKRRI